jgi:hypothetical protein
MGVYKHYPECTCLKQSSTLYSILMIYYTHLKTLEVNFNSEMRVFLVFFLSVSYLCFIGTKEFQSYMGPQEPGCPIPHTKFQDQDNNPHQGLTHSVFSPQLQVPTPTYGQLSRCHAWEVQLENTFWPETEFSSTWPNDLKLPRTWGYMSYKYSS